MDIKKGINTFVTNLSNLVTNKEQPNFRKDGWSNILTNINTNKGRAANTSFAYSAPLDRYTLDYIYNSDGIGRRIINIIIDDAMRGFITCDNDVTKELQRVKSKQRLIEAASFARLFGGSILVAFVDDGKEMDKPLNLKTIKKVVSLRAYDRYQISWLPTDLSTDYYNEWYGEPEVFNITPHNQTMFRVHRSRCHIFGGERVSNLQKANNKGWDNSVIQAVYESLRNYGSSINATAEIIQDFIQTVLTIDGLTDMIIQGKEDEIIKRANLIDFSRSVSNTVFVDAQNEAYDKKASSVGGLSELIDRFIENISATTGIPVTRLSGRAAGGLNASGESDIGNWHDIVDAYRSDELEPCINWLIDIMKAQTMWSDRPENFEWSFPALKVPNDKEWAEIKHITAKTDEIYINAGAADATQMFQERYANGKFNTEISVDGIGEGVIDDLEVDQENADLPLLPVSSVKKDSEDVVDQPTISDDLVKKILELM